MDNHFRTIDRQRRAGVLLHPTSLPGPLSNGDIGHQAYRFIEFLSASGFKVWQMLPLGPTHDDKSPYQCLSSHAGNPLLISIDWLMDKGWLNKDYSTTNKNQENYRSTCLQQASDHFYNMDDDIWNENLQVFLNQHNHWLDDYALFIALKKNHKNQAWYHWPEIFRQRNNASLEIARLELQSTIRQTIFEQFVFFTQWHEIHEYAKQNNIELFGDMPIYVAKDSADVWAQRKNFLMDDNGDMKYIAGVPPDAFSKTGQRWANPLYDWDYMQSTGFSWWKDRFHSHLELFDMVRFDHFRGLQACWQIPQEDDTAINGSWVEVPGREMLQTMFDEFHYLPLVAEDLGMITDPVIELKKSFNLPGMKVLQFAFDGHNDNPHLPHLHEIDDVVYTGTHDNDTTFGWSLNEDNYNKDFFEEYTGFKVESSEQHVWSMIRLALSSVSFLCILPLQDLLILDTSSRMNTPGKIGGNWEWRFDWEQIDPELKEKCSELMKLYQR